MENQIYIPTKEFASTLGVQSNTVRRGFCVDGHYLGIAPVKLPNHRLLWPKAEIKRLFPSVQTSDSNETRPMLSSHAGGGVRAMEKQTITGYFANDFLPLYEKYLPNIKPGTNGQSLSLCCFHDDKTPSLSIDNKTGLFKCFGCNASGSIFDFYAKKHDLSLPGDFPKVIDAIASDFDIKATEKRSRIVKTYDYTDAAGDLLFQVCRMDPKSFRRRRPDGKGGWIWNMKKVEPVLYRLPEVLKADEIILVEGEKDADSLNALGYTATTNPMGAGKWQKQYTDILKGKHIVLIPDNDDPGRAHMQKVAAELHGKAASVKILELPGLPLNGDVSDFIATFGDKETAKERLAIMLENAEAYDPKAENVLTDGQKTDAWAGQIYDLSDAYKQREPLRYVIGGIIPVGTLSCWYSSPGSLKSLVLGHASMSVVSGERWLGREVTQGPVLWIDLDNGKRRSHERFEALARGLNLPESAPFYYVSMPTPSFNAGNLPDIEALEKRITDRSITLVIIDNLALISPSADENSDQMVLVMSNLRLLAERTGAAIVVIHHQRKSSGTNSRAGESLRGHSSIEAALDLALRIDREPDSNFITIQSTKTRDCDVPVFGCEFRYEHKPDSTELLTAGFVRIEVEDTTSTKAIEKSIISVVQSNPGINQKTLVEEVNSALQVAVNLIRKVLKNLVKKHRVKSKDGAHGAKLYYATE